MHRGQKGASAHASIYPIKHSTQRINKLFMIDIFIIVLLLWAAFSGWRAGFLKEIISTAGFLVGLFVAATCYSVFGEMLAVNGTEVNMFTNIVAFLILWIIVPIVLGFVANVLTKALKGMKLGMPNSILGAAVSFVKYFILLSCVLNVMSALHIMNQERVATSHLYGPVTAALEVFLPEGQTDAGAREQEAADSAAEQPDTVWVDMKQPGK